MNHVPSVRRALLTGATVGALALALTGCSLLSQITGGSTAERDVDTNEVIASGQESAFQMQVGDCFMDDNSMGEISDVPVVPCADAHHNEVYYTADLEGKEWPGEDAISERANQMCYDQFAGFVGVAYEESEIDFFPIMPSEGSWVEMNDREIVCSVWDSTAETVTGSLKGANR